MPCEREILSFDAASGTQVMSRSPADRPVTVPSRLARWLRGPRHVNRGS